MYLESLKDIKRGKEKCSYFLQET